jgi:hypothetical protein
MQISDVIIKQIMEVRSDGSVNMLDVTSVQRLAHDMGLYDLVIFIEENKQDYVAFIMRGVRG